VIEVLDVVSKDVAKPLALVIHDVVDKLVGERLAL
jgi:hypothetical protein